MGLWARADDAEEQHMEGVSFHLFVAFVSNHENVNVFRQSN
jgi:hypothetical protein